MRELENLARRLAALYPHEVITLAVIEAELTQPRRHAGYGDGGTPDNLSAAVERNLARYFPVSRTACRRLACIIGCCAKWNIRF